MFSPRRAPTLLRRFWAETAAVSATEYAVMIGLIALAAIAAAGGIGRSMQGIYDVIEAEVSSST